VDVRSVDPRGTHWEVTSPTFHVYFWEPQKPPADEVDAPVGYRSTEFEVSDADVRDVLAWADQRVSSQGQYTIYAVVDHGGEQGLVLLAGSDPTGDRPET
jgi:hypothetical protein